MTEREQSRVLREADDQFTVHAETDPETAVETAQMRSQRRRHLTAIETTREGTSILDGDGRFVSVNEACADLYEYDPDGLLGEHWECLYPDDEVSLARQGILTTIEEQGHWHGRTTGLRADGSTFLEDHVASMTTDSDRVCTVRDATDREER
ncbi:MAG: PAS domain S-box protein [Haloglomus sp.]